MRMILTMIIFAIFTAPSPQSLMMNGGNGVLGGMGGPGVGVPPGMSPGMGVACVFQIPWDRLPDYVIQTLEEGRKLDKRWILLRYCLTPSQFHSNQQSSNSTLLFTSFCSNLLWQCALINRLRILTFRCTAGVEFIHWSCIAAVPYTTLKTNQV